jgi:hypothetical protein
MSEKAADLASSIEKSLSNAAEWEKKKTSIPGIFLVRLPGEKLRVMLEFNPPDESGGPSKRKGLYFGDRATVEAARTAFPDKRLDDLIAAVEKLSARGAPERGVKGGKGDDVFEV